MDPGRAVVAELSVDQHEICLQQIPVFGGSTLGIALGGA